MRRRQLSRNPVLEADADIDALTQSRGDTDEKGMQDFLLFQISDSGIGMTPEQLGKLFKPFSQADPSIARKYGGTGLGLTICLKLCALLNGQLKVSSVHGKGSTFLLILPTFLELPPKLEAAKPEPAPPSIGS